MADREDGGPAGREPELAPGPGPEPGEEFEIVDRSQLPSPGELRSAARTRTPAESWSAPILTLARKATGNLSASCGSALRAAAGLGAGDGGGERAARAGRLGRERGCGGEAALGWAPHLAGPTSCGDSLGLGAGRGSAVGPCT
jgi:hypothetical protein